jgi:hypothetical protein
LLARTDERSLELALTRSQDADIDLTILRLMDGVTPVEEVARQAAAQFPAHLSFDSALARVQHLVEYYGCQMGSDHKP